MLRKLVGASIAFVLVAGVALAADEKVQQRARPVRGQLVKCDLEKGMICVLVKKNRQDEGTKTEFKVTDDTKFVINKGRGEKPVTLTKSDASKDEFKNAFKENARVTVTLSDDGKTIKTIATGGGRRRPQRDS
jgi:hypothetical protein